MVLSAGEKTAQTRPMLVAKGRWNDQFRELPAQNIRPAMTEHFLRRGIPFKHLAFVVDCNDCVQGGLQNRSFTRLPFDHRRFRLFAL